MKLRMKIMLPILFNLAFFTGYLLIQIAGLSKNEDIFQELCVTDIAALQQADDLNADILQMQGLLTSVSLTKKEEQFRLAEDYLASAKEKIQALSDLLPDDRQLLASLTADLDSFFQCGTDMAKAYTTVSTEAGSEYLADFEEKAATLSASIDTLLAHIGTAMEEAKAYTSYKNKELRSFGILILVIDLLLSGFTISSCDLTIAKPIQKTIKAVLVLSEHDLTGEALSIKNKDEIGDLARAFNHLQDFLRQTMLQMHEMSEKLKNSSGNLDDNTKDVAKAIRETAGAISEIAVTVGEEANETQEAAERMKESADALQKSVHISDGLEDASKKMVEISTAGLRTVEDLSHAANDTQHAFQEILATMEQITVSSERISVTSGLIEDIASQTNLLSLNATIEAARAGEAGRGFAVVADEIRGLADNSADAVKEINQMIQALRDSVTRTNEVLRSAGSMMEHQRTAVTDTKDRYHSIMENLKSIDLEIDRLADVNKTMQNVNQRMDDTITGLSSMSEENAASTEECSASTQEILASVSTVAEICSHVRLEADNLADLANAFQL